MELEWKKFKHTPAANSNERCKLCQAQDGRLFATVVGINSGLEL